MTKILLVYPGKGVYFEQPPIGLLQLAGYTIQNGYDVTVRFRPLNEEYETIIDNYDIIGISGTTQVIEDGYWCADLARSRGKFVVMGGPHVSALPEEAIKHCDAVVIGEGEKTFIDIIKERKKGIFNGDILDNLDELPYIPWELINHEYFFDVNKRNPISMSTFIPSNEKVSYIISSRGCPFRCKFCYNSKRTSQIRYQSVDRVINEILYTIDKYKINNFVFLEDNFISNKNRAIEFCNKIIANGIDIIFGINARVDNIDESIIRILNSAGCLQIAFGLESVEQSILDYYNKNINVDQMIKAISLCNKNGIISQGSFIIGHKDSIYTLKKMQYFICDNPLDGGIGICYLTPFPGSMIYDELKESQNFNWNNLKYDNITIPFESRKNQIVEIAEFTRHLAMYLVIGREYSRIMKFNRLKKLKEIYKK